MIVGLAFMVTVGVLTFVHGIKGKDEFADFRAGYGLGIFVSSTLALLFFYMETCYD